MSDNDFALESLQQKNWPCSVHRLLTILQDENSFNFSTKSSFEVNKIIYSTMEILVLCKVVYNLIHIAITNNHDYLKLLPQRELDNIDQDLHRNSIFLENLKNEIDSKEIINAFNYFFCSYGRFPSNLTLIAVPQGNIPRLKKMSYHVINYIKILTEMTAEDLSPCNFLLL